MLTYDYNPATKSVASATATTVTFTSADIPGGDSQGGGVVFFDVHLSGTGADVDSLTRIVLKAGGDTIVSINEDELQSFIQRFSRSNWDLADADTTLRVPLYIMDAKGDERFDCGFPHGKSAQLEITCDTSWTAGGTMKVSWGHWSRPFKYYPKIIGSQCGIAASTTNGRYDLTQEGELLRGFGLETSGLDRVRLVLGGVQYVHLDNEGYDSAQRGEQTDTITDPLWFKLHQPVPISGRGTSYFNLDTGSGWSGVSSPISLYSLVPQAAPSK